MRYSRRLNAHSERKNDAAMIATPTTANSAILRVSIAVF
jgi:hypothetical protein